LVTESLLLVLQVKSWLEIFCCFTTRSTFD